VNGSRGAAVPFRSAFTAPTIAAAEQRLRVLYGDVRLGGLGGYAERTAGDGRFALAEVMLDGEFQVEADARDVTIAFSTPGYRWQTGEESGDLAAAPALFQPGRAMRSRIRGRSRITTASFDGAALRSFAAAYYGSDLPVRFDGATAASRDLGLAWRRTVAELDVAGMLQSDLARTTAFEALAAIALEGFRLAGDRAERATTARGRLAAHRRAARFLDEHAAAPIGEADAARAAGVSVAELRVAFAAHSAAGWTPVQHLHRARLAAAHLELAEADPTDGATVTGIGARWGFTKPSRFAARHREIYGTTPGSVLLG